MGLDELRRIREDRGKPKEKKVYQMRKVSLKRQKQIEESSAAAKNEKFIKPVISGTAELNRWFLERRKEMTGICAHCGDPSCRNSDEYYKFSIAHILPKRIFKSVATHPLNWIELCFWGNSCHTNMDNSTLDLIDLNCFAIVIERFVAIYPDIDPQERKYIPDILLQYVEVEK